MEKQEYRAVIKFLEKKGLNPREIFKELHGVYGESAPSERTVERWVIAFRRGRDSLEDDPRCGAPSTSVNEDTVKEVEQMVMDNRQITQREIANRMNISVGSVATILSDRLNMHKCNARWVPRILTPAMKEVRVACCRELLALFDDPTVDFCYRIVTGDETWVHHYDPLTPQESKIWKRPSSPTIQRPRLQNSAGKIMLSVFWDSQGVLLLDFLPHGQTVTGDYYANLIFQLREAIKNKRRGKLTAGPLLLHDNAPPHKSRTARAAIRTSGFEELDHPPYSPDVAPSDFFLFARLKKDLRGKKFSSDEELKETVDQWFASKTSDFFSAGISALGGRYRQMIHTNGEYFE